MYKPSLLPADLARIADALASMPVSGPVFNQYSPHAPTHLRRANGQRLNNLVLYWQKMVTYQPEMLLVGEAPGYRGCRLTGVPFASPAIINQTCGSHSFFGEEHGFVIPDESSAIWKEASATIVWQTITHLERPPLLWNAFPYHPFLPGNSQSNRRPLQRELQMGLPFLLRLIALFDVRIIVAVGNTAADVLHQAGISAHKIRHPSHGGKRTFADGLHAVASGQGNNL